MAEQKIETRKDVKNTAKFWQDQIQGEEKEGDKWRERGRGVVNRYRDERKRDTEARTDNHIRKFNILWANTEVLKPAIYSKTPVPDVRRRYLDKDPVGRFAAELMERAIGFSVDDIEHDFDKAMEAIRDDLLLPGRGQGRIKYKPLFQRRAVEIIPEGPQLDEQGLPVLDEAGEPVVLPERMMLDGQEVEPDGEDKDGKPFIDQKVDEAVWLEHVYWEDYRQSPARSESKVWWKAYKHRFTRSELKRRFKERAKDVELDEIIEGIDNREDLDDEFKRATVWEIWDRPSKQVYWVHTTHDKVLRTDEDPLGLQGFFPSPEALVANKTSNTWVPVPEYCIYQDQAEELDKVTARINRLIGALKVRGAYPDVLKNMENLLNSDESDLVPIEDWQTLQDFGGLQNAINWLPIEQIAKVLVQLYQQREALKAEIFELTGLSDIVRGQTNPNETFGAQKLKGDFGTLRMTPRQKPIQRYVRDIFRMLGEVISEHFDPRILSAMTGMPQPDDQTGPQMFQQAMQMLKQDKVRSFRIDIETDSTVQPDAQAEKAAATEFVAAATGFIERAGVIGAQAPPAVPLLMEMFKFAVRPFKAGRPLEQKIDEAAEAFSQQAQQAQQNPQPDPEAIKAQTEAQKAQADIQVKQAELQVRAVEVEMKKAELQITQIEAQTKAQTESQKAEADVLSSQVDAAGKQAETEIKRLEVGLKQRELELKQQELQLKREQAEFDARMKRAEFEQMSSEETPESNGKDTSPPVVNVTVDAAKSTRRQISFERGSDGKITGATEETEE